MNRSHENQRGIDNVLRMEKEESTLYGLHNMYSWNKIKHKYTFFLAKMISKNTIQVKKYGNNREQIEGWARNHPDYVFIENGEFII